MAMKTLLTLALCLLAVSVVSATNHICCKPPSGKTFQTSGMACTQAKCNAAMALSSLSNLIELLDRCRDHFGGIAFVQQSMRCAVPELSRAHYMALAYSVDDTATSREHAQIAAQVLGYGCISQSTTAPCQALHKEHFNSNTHIFGYVSPQVSIDSLDSVNYTTSLTKLVRSCLASTIESFDKSEFKTGASRCAAVGFNNSQADFTGVAFNLDQVPASQCTSCATSGELPFCAGHYTNTRGIRCNSRQGDRVAQSFYEQWTTLETAKINGVAIKANTTDCLLVLRTAACEVSLGLCRNQNSLTYCKNTCESVFTSKCDLSASNAVTVCMGLAATKSTAPCTSTPTTPDTNLANRTLYELKDVNGTNKLTRFSTKYNVTSSDQSVATFMAEHAAAVCRNVSRSPCEVREVVTNGKITSLTVISTKLVTSAKAQEETTAASTILNRTFGAAASVSSTQVASQVVALKAATPSSPSSSSAVSVSLTGLLIAAVLATLQA